MDIKCLYFVGKTHWGYSLYLFALAGMYGTKDEGPALLQLFFYFVSTYVLAIALFIIVLVKTPVTRQYLRTLLGENYLVEHLGQQMATQTTAKIFLAWVGVLGAEKMSQSVDRYWNNQAADLQEAKQMDLWKEYGDNPSMKEAQDLLDKVSALREKKPQGLSEQAFKVIREVLDYQQ